MSSRIFVASSAAALLVCALSGCASIAPSAAQSAPSAAAPSAPPSAPLEEPFRSILARWNYYRASVGLPAIVADPALNQAALHHAKYLVNNHIDAADAVIKNGRMIENGWNASAHSESEGNSWYTDDGAKWADYSNVVRGTSIPTDGAALVDEQAARTDSLAVVDPQLAAVGFGLFCEKDNCVGSTGYRRGLDKSEFLALYEGNAMDWNPRNGTMPFTVARLRKPIEFPPSGMQFPVRAYRGSEYPDPLIGCHGYLAPTGPAIVLQLGAPTQGDDVKISSGTLSEGGRQLDTCIFDATSYANPDGAQQKWARRVLHAYGAVVMIPKSPLQPGHQYTASVVADSQTYNWSFSIAPDAK